MNELNEKFTGPLLPYLPGRQNREELCSEKSQESQLSDSFQTTFVGVLSSCHRQGDDYSICPTFMHFPGQPWRRLPGYLAPITESLNKGSKAQSEIIFHILDTPLQVASSLGCYLIYSITLKLSYN